MSVENFVCPNCKAKYKLVRMDAAPGPTVDSELACVSCGEPLTPRDGGFLLKYFLVEGRREGLRAV